MLQANPAEGVKLADLHPKFGFDEKDKTFFYQWLEDLLELIELELQKIGAVYRRKHSRQYWYCNQIWVTAIEFKKWD